MRFAYRITAACAALCALPILAKSPVLSKYFVVPANDGAGREIARRFDVEGHRGNGIFVYVEPKNAADLRALSREAELVDPDITGTLRASLQRDRGWHNYNTVTSALQQYATTYPKLASTLSAGTTGGGRNIPALHVVSTAPSERGKATLMITGCTHGNELITTEVVLGFIDALLKGYGTDGRVTRMVDEHDIYFVPIASPDGYAVQERYTEGVDPNRDFPYPDDESHQSVKTIQSMMAFATAKQIKGSIDFHSAAGMVFFPWAYTYDPIPSADYKDLDALTTQMAATNGYQHGQIAQTIYVAPGSSADYYYWKLHARSLGVEISQDGTPSLIPSMLKENMEMTWQFIESF